MKKNIFLLMLLTISFVLKGQNFSLKLKLPYNSEAKVSNLLKNKEEKLNKLFQKYESIGLEACYPNAKNPELKSYYTIKGKGKRNDAIEELIKLEIFEAISEEDTFCISTCTDPVSVNDPWIVHNWANNYAMELIDANCAWFISQGSTNIHIGIADTDFEITHDDLENQIASIDGQSSGNHQHGTRVAGLASPETNNNFGISGIGYNSQIAAHRIIHTVNSQGDALASSGNIRNAIWNLYQDGRPIINVSWTGTGLDVIAAQEITQNGTVLVLAAGNTPTSTNHSAIADIPGVIVVTSVNEDNEHGPSGHAHNQWVDICSPGVNVTTTLDNNTIGGVWGTSFASPIVSGTIALMLEVNPCLTPAEIELLIEESADPVADAQNFVGLLGAGRLNAFEALIAAGARNYNNHSFSGNQNLTAGFGFNLINSIVDNNSDIQLTARKEVNISGTFNVPVGSTFSIDIEPNTQTNCQ
jgi:subtilisin family serine protease